MIGTTCNLKLSDLIANEFLRHKEYPHLCLSCGTAIGTHFNDDAPKVSSSSIPTLSTYPYLPSHEQSNPMLLVDSNPNKLIIESSPSKPQYVIDVEKKFRLCKGSIYCSQPEYLAQQKFAIASKQRRTPFPPFDEIIKNVETAELQLHPYSRHRAYYYIEERNQIRLKISCVNSQTIGVNCPFVLLARRQKEQKNSTDLFAKVTKVNLFHYCQSAQFMESSLHQQQLPSSFSSNSSSTTSEERAHMNPSSTNESSQPPSFSTTELLQQPTSTTIESSSAAESMLPAAISNSSSSIVNDVETSTVFVAQQRQEGEIKNDVITLQYRRRNVSTKRMKGTSIVLQTFSAVRNLKRKQGAVETMAIS